MADEVQEGGTPVKSGGGGSKLIVGGAVVLMAAIGGLCTYLFVLRPMLADPEVETDAMLEAAALRADLPMVPTPVMFDPVPVSIIREGGQPASTLLFGITFECNDEATAALVEQYRYRFLDMLIKLHDSRTRSELEDTVLLKESIQRQALQKSNDILERLQKEPVVEIRITAVLHNMFVVQDQT